MPRLFYFFIKQFIMNKKIIVSLLALVLVAGLTACTNPLQKEDSVATGNVEVNDEVAGNLDIVEEVMDANEKVVEKDAPEMNVVA